MKNENELNTMVNNIIEAKTSKEQEYHRNQLVDYILGMQIHCQSLQMKINSIPPREDWD
tara:strand:+ start:239 stop:415 length:177 start_codon:yes stop_codon:yes gene_type:complete